MFDLLTRKRSKRRCTARRTTATRATKNRLEAQGIGAARDMTDRSRRYRPCVTEADDLSLLPPDVAASANVDSNGEVWWGADDAVKAVNALAGAGLVILGLDVRDYDDDGHFVETPCCVFETTGSDDVERSRVAELAALARPDRIGNTVLITWRTGA